MTKTAFRQSSDLSVLGQQVENLKNGNESLSKELIQNRTDKTNAEEERKQVLEKNKNLKTFADETSKITIEVKKQNRELRDAIDFWEKESKATSVQLNESVQVENKLRKWVTNLEAEGTKNTSIKGGLAKNVASLKSTAAEMGTVIEGLLSENKYLRFINTDFRKKLSKPRYLSMGAIAKREGFKMPQGMENIRTQNLGNAAPTLLKFKQESSHGN
jgi:regulator of replication initiation timing